MSGSRLSCRGRRLASEATILDVGEDILVVQGTLLGVVGLELDERMVRGVYRVRQSFTVSTEIEIDAVGVETLY